MLWQEIINEAQSMHKNSLIKNFYQTNLLAFESIEEALSNLVIKLLKKTNTLNPSFEQAIKEFFTREETLIVIEADLRAAYERDPACLNLSDVFLFYKGFHALCFYRLAHFLLKDQDDRPTALFLQYLSSTEFSVDINPAAVIGKGFFIDHSHSIVIGETCVIKDNVSILQDVTLGGTGKKKGKDRHPKVGEGVLVGAGAKVLGNINIGDHSIIGASSVVLSDIPNNSVAVGIPAKVVKKNLAEYPAKQLNHSIVKPG